jgi:zinc protease
MTDRKNTAALTLFLAGWLATAPAQAQAPQAAQTAQQPAAAKPAGGSAIELVTLPGSTPLVSIRLLFDVGSIHDPKGKEGLATLTALMVSQAGTQKRSYTELLDALYPMAASIGTNTDREATVFVGTVHQETLTDYVKLLQETLLQPAFAESDFTRNKEQLLAYLTNTLRSSDELLGLEMLQQEIFEGHPYGHEPAGTVEALQSITLDDVKKFYRDNYTQGNLMLGVAGGYPQGFPESLAAQLAAALPAGQKGRMELPPPPKITGRNFTLVEKETGSVGIHLGHTLPINRSHPDYYPLMVANSYLGEHRTMFGRLMNQLRADRGLNYGDYSYIEYWANPPGTDYPTAGVPRRQQYFSIWIRPVVPTDAQFALRAALQELRQLHEKGMPQEDFDTVRSLLVNYSKLWAQSPSERLGYAMDSRFYGMPSYIEEIDARLQKLTLQEVNAAIKKYLDPDDWDVVMVTNNARQLEETLRKDAPSPKTYNSQVPETVLAEDKVFQALPVKPTAVEIVPVAEVFQK